MDALATLGVFPPADYIAFLTTSNGVEGTIGRSRYVALWAVDQLVTLNATYHVTEFAPSLVLFGSDGGDVAYAFDRRESGRIVAVRFVGMRDDNTQILGATFVEVLERIANGNEP